MLVSVCVHVCETEWKLSKTCAYVNFVLVTRNDRGRGGGEGRGEVRGGGGGGGHINFDIVRPQLPLSL